MFSACSTVPGTYPFGDSKEIEAIKSTHEIIEAELLDVSIQRFEPGTLPEDEEDRRGLSQEIRKAESRYMPVHLKYTMQRTGYWGNIRVVPDKNEASEIQVQGKILNSDGETIEVEIRVSDSRNKLWFEKNYEESAPYSKIKNTEIEKKELYQNLYNRISNDIIRYRQKLTSKDIVSIRNTAELRFAQFMAPTIFSDYLKKGWNKEFKIVRLPALDDPMLNRIRAIKTRDELLMDTINNYYDVYYNDMWETYENWRKFRSEELEKIREIERKALTQKVLGAAAIIGAIALGASSNAEVRDRTGVLSSIMIAGGTYALYSGFKTSKETEINKAAIEELGESFAAEIEPVNIEVEGKTMKLTGSAEQQFSRWREVLSEIYKKETELYQ